MKIILRFAWLGLAFRIFQTDIETLPINPHSFINDENQNYKDLRM
jgi:hypothetical protein